MIYNSINNKTIDANLWLLKNVYKIRMWIAIILGLGIVAIIYILSINIVSLAESNGQFSKLYDNIISNKNFVTIDNYLKSIAPESLVLESSGVVPGYSDKYYDFYALVKNKNTNYVVDSIDYYFKYDNGKTDVQKDKVSINTEKFLFLTGVDSQDVDITSTDFIVKDLNWKLVDKQANKNVSRYTDTNVPKNCLFLDDNLSVESLKVTKNIQSVTNREVDVLSFDVKNSSLYNYRTINNKIVFYDKEGKIVGIFQKELYLLNSGESKSISINVSSNIKDLNSVLVTPEIDLCSEDSFISKE